MDITNLISSVGFPIAVAAYLLIREDKVLKQLTEAVSELTKMIGKLTEEE